jgi:beta-glucosidase
MHQNALRLSIEWSRLEPAEGTWDGEAVARYRGMLGALRDRGIEPMVTLAHFTTPLWLAKKGGWEHEAAPQHFHRFAARAAETFGDLVDLWCTINEPNVHAAYSYLLGEWPPQKKSLLAAFRVLRHQMMAHGLAYRVIHDRQPGARVGLAQHLRVFDPLNPHSALDRWAARLQDHLFNGLVLEVAASGALPFPLGLGTVPGAGTDTQDFVGVNYYSRDMVSFDITQPGMLFARRSAKAGAEFSMEGWGEIYPQGLYRSLKRVGRYGRPVYVTETGVPDNDDSLRPQFLLTHLAATHRALREGVPVKGFYFWTLVDNFEWAEGFAARFGLVHLNLEDGQRTLKRSGKLYGEIGNAGGISARMVERYAPKARAQVFEGF